MTITVDDFGNLTAPQKTIAQTYLDFEATLRGSNGQDLRPVPPATMTLSQAKRADEICREINTLVGKIQRAAKYVADFRRKEAAEANEAANP